MAVALGLLIIPLLIAVLLIIPVLVALIYKGSYTRKINEQMGQGGASRKLMTPFTAGLITFMGEMLIIVGMFVLFMIPGNSGMTKGEYTEISANDSRSWTYSTDEVADTEYAVFNGNLVENYAMTSGRKGDFTYYAYHRMAGSEDMPEYALIVEYAGSGEAGDFVGSTTYGREPNSIFLGNGCPNSGDNRVVAVIWSDDLTVKTGENESDELETVVIEKDEVHLSYTLELYEKTPADASEEFDPDVIDRITIDLSDLSF